MLIVLLVVGAITISPSLAKKIEQDRERFIPVWLEWKDRPLNPYILEIYGARARTYFSDLQLSSYYMPGWLIERTGEFEEIKSIREVAVLKRKSVKTEFPPNYNLSSVSYGLSYSQLAPMNIPAVHDEGYMGYGVKIAILDTGFDSSHISLRHIWNRGGVIKAHDFNSGDRLRSTGGEPTLPYSGVLYINSYSATVFGDTVVVVMSTASEDSLSGYHVRNRWKNFYTYGVKTGFDVYWSTEIFSVGTSDSFAIEPSIIKIEDSLFVVYEVSSPSGVELVMAKGAFGGDIDITLPIPSNFQGNRLAPLVFERADTLYIWYFVEGRGLAFIKYFDGFFGETVVVTDSSRFGGFDVAFDDSLATGVVSVGEELRQFTFNLNTGEVSHETMGPGINPSFLSGGYISYVWGDSLFVHFPDGNDIFVSDHVYPSKTELFEENGEILLIYSDKAGNLLKTNINSLNVVDTLDVIFSDSPTYIDGLLFWRKRGDEDVSIDNYIPHIWFRDPRYHGTKMLSVIGGYYPGNLIGVAPAASFLLAKTEKTKTAAGQPFENQVEEDFWVEALSWAIDNGAQVVSSSLGYIDWYTKSDMDGETSPASRAASKAIERGVIVVSAMGNHPWDRSILPDPSTGDTTLVAPADAKDIVAVGVWSEDSLGNFIPHGAFGPTADGRIKPEVIAPSVNVVTATDTLFEGDTIPQWIGYGSGTSFGTALVAGAIALIMEAHPEWDARMVRNALLETARPVEIPGYSGAPVPNNVTGYGLPDIYAAIHLEEPTFRTKGGNVFLDPYPNPVVGQDYLNIAFHLSNLTYVTLRVYTLRGEKIFEVNLTPEQVSLDRNVFKWNLKTSSGKRIAPGLYLLFLSTGYGSSVAKFAVVK